MGAGIIGRMTACCLALDKQRVVRCEKGRIGAKHGSRYRGCICPQRRDPAKLAILSTRWIFTAPI